MKVLESVLSITTLISLFRVGTAVECYHCHQTSKECVNGMKKYLQTADCLEDQCFILKYETEMPGVLVLAAYRGCHSLQKNALLNSVATPKHVMREKEYHICNTTLCNAAAKTLPSTLFSVFICFIYFMFVIT